MLRNARGQVGERDGFDYDYFRAFTESIKLTAMTLTDEELDLIALVRLRPQAANQIYRVAEAMIFRADNAEREHVANCAEVMNLLCISHGRSEDNALKKGAAMAFLRANGWTHYGAQRAVGLTCKSARMSIRSTKLHAERMKNNLYKVTFSEVQKKLGEWLRKKNKQTTKGD